MRRITQKLWLTTARVVGRKLCSLGWKEIPCPHAGLLLRFSEPASNAALSRVCTSVRRLNAGLRTTTGGWFQCLLWRGISMSLFSSLPGKLPRRWPLSQVLLAPCPGKSILTKGRTCDSLTSEFSSGEFSPSVGSRKWLNTFKLNVKVAMHGHSLKRLRAPWPGHRFQPGSFSYSKWHRPSGCKYSYHNIFILSAIHAYQFWQRQS